MDVAVERIGSVGAGCKVFVAATLAGMAVSVCATVVATWSSNGPEGRGWTSPQAAERINKAAMRSSGWRLERTI
jgi:hypothetical protein